MDKISPCLWFNGNAEQAVQFYLSVFGGEEIDRLYYNSAGPGPEGGVLSINFRLCGQTFIALNGGADVEFNHALSLLVNCDSQQEIDQLWERLLAGGGRTLHCGWVQDRFGVCWQIIPRALDKMLQDKAPPVMAALLQMDKPDLAALEKACQ